jgi:hypothetical protein
MSMPYCKSRSFVAATISLRISINKRHVCYLKSIEFSLNHRLSIIVALIAVLGGGIFVGFQLPVDAVPDITNVQVVVNAKTGGLDPQQGGEIRHVFHRN